MLIEIRWPSLVLGAVFCANTWAVQNCELNGESVSRANGSTTAGDVAFAPGGARLSRWSCQRCTSRASSAGVLGSPKWFSSTMTGLPRAQASERWVLGWGAEAEVLAPEELRRQISRTVSALAARYTT